MAERIGDSLAGGESQSCILLNDVNPVEPRDRALKNLLNSSIKRQAGFPGYGEEKRTDAGQHHLR